VLIERPNVGTQISCWPKVEHLENQDVSTSDESNQGLGGETTIRLMLKVVEKRSLGQALTAKESAVLVGISHSTAREWFHSPGFQMFRGKGFWPDFVNGDSPKQDCSGVPPRRRERVISAMFPALKRICRAVLNE
jgi:hypothetical protein